MKYIIGFFLSFICSLGISQIQINEVYLFPEGNRSSVERFIELKNNGSLSIDLSGYKVCMKGEGGESCDVIDSHKSSVTQLKPGKIVFLKVNRKKLKDNFLYVQLEHSNKSIIELYNEQGDKIDELSIENINRKNSVSKVVGAKDTWIETSPTKGTKNSRRELGASFQYSWEEVYTETVLDNETNGDTTFVKEIKDTMFTDKIKINEVFFVHAPDGFLNRDFWIELTNTSDSYIDATKLSITTDPLYGKKRITYKENKNGQYLLAPGSHTMVNLSRVDDYQSNLYALIEDKSPTIYIYQNDSIIDQVTVLPLKRNQSYSRLPDATGNFMVVNLQTKNNVNDQVLPSEFTINKTTVFHTVGASLSDYNLRNTSNRTRLRRGLDLGVAWERPKGRLLTRYNLVYSRQGFRIKSDSVISTSVGSSTWETRGTSKMDYMKFKFELGTSVIPKWNLFIGNELSILVKQTVEASTKFITVNNVSGVSNVFVQNFTDDDGKPFQADNIDLNLSIGVEYQVKPSLYIHLSYTRDYFSINFNRALDAPNEILTDYYLLRFMVPLWKSNKLRDKKYVFLKGQ